MATSQELVNRFANRSTAPLSRIMLCTPLNRWCLTSDVVLLFVFHLAGAKPVKAILITIDDRQTVFRWRYYQILCSNLVELSGVLQHSIQENPPFENKRQLF